MKIEWQEMGPAKPAKVLGESRFTADEVHALRVAVNEYLEAMEDMAFEGKVSEEQWKVLRGKLKGLSLEMVWKERAAQRTWAPRRHGTFEDCVAWQQKVALEQHLDEVAQESANVAAQVTGAFEQAEELQRAKQVMGDDVRRRLEEYGEVAWETWWAAASRRLKDLERVDGELSEGYEGLAKDVQDLWTQGRELRRDLDDLRSLVLELGEALSRHSEGVRH